MRTKGSMDVSVKVAWIGVVGTIGAAIIAALIGKFPWSISSSPPSTPKPTVIWELTISPNTQGLKSLTTGFYYVIVTAHVVNHATDGNTHDVLATMFHLYPIIGGSTDFAAREQLILPINSADYPIYHNTSKDIQLTFLVPLYQNKFALYLNNADYSWTFSITPPS